MSDQNWHDPSEVAREHAHDRLMAFLCCACAIIGAILGFVIGFQSAGTGGALVGATIGFIIGCFAGPIIFFLLLILPRLLLPVSFLLAAGLAVAAIAFLIKFLWNVGKS